MKRLAAFLMLLISSTSLFGGTKKDVYPMPCGNVWHAVKDTVLNSGEYVTVFLDNSEMIASFAQGVGNSFHIDSAVLNAKGDSCEMQVQTNSVAFHDDAGNFKKRVDSSLAPLKSTAAAPAKHDRGAK